jgi:hypothetical protein
MENPPAGFVSHKMFQHAITREYDRKHKQVLCPENAISTNRYLKI